MEKVASSKREKRGVQIVLFCASSLFSQNEDRRMHSVVKGFHRHSKEWNAELESQILDSGKTWITYGHEWNTQEDRKRWDNTLRLLCKTDDPVQVVN